MRLMYVLPAEAFGGAERQGILHIRRLRDFGVDLLPIVGPADPVQRSLRDYGVRDFECCQAFPQRTHAKMNLVGNLSFGAHYARAFFRSSDHLIRLGREHQTDLILAGRSFGWAIAARAARALGIPYLIRAGSRAFTTPMRLGIRALKRRYGPPRALLANCLAVQDSLLRIFRCPAEIVRNGVDTCQFDPSRFIPLREAGPAVIGLAARPSPEKGLETFAEIVKRVTRQAPETLFLIAGEFGWRAHYQRTFSRMGLSANVRFEGHVASMPEFFSRCDLVVLTSPERSIEGSPNALLEAMSMARPVVATSVGGIPELVRDGVEGRLVAPDAPDAFAGAIRALLSDRALRLRMGTAGRQRVIARHSEQAVMEALVGALQRFGGAGLRAR